MKPRLRKWLIRTAQVMGGLLLGLVVTELVFRWRDDGAFPHLNVYRPDPVLGVRLEPGAETRIAFGGNPATSVRINRDGYRGANLPAPSPGRAEVLVVGDSQVFGLGVEEGQTFSARLGVQLGKDALVINGGVPTYGPGEYAAVVGEVLEKRPVKTVIFTINMVNDLFEASRPNAQRHAVWDGWAVRRESAPHEVSSFPGRHLLFNRSHAFFALRRWWHSRGPALDDRGFSSEGTWEDVAKGGEEQKARHTADAAQARDRRAQLSSFSRELRETEDAIDLATRRKLGDVEYFQLEAARANPGDIVEQGSPYAEASRGVRVTAAQIREGATYRAKVQAELLAKAKAKGDQEVIDAFTRRDGLERQLALLDAGYQVGDLETPLAPILRDVKALCDAKGARLVVLVLPMDVQVSAEEWKKYGAQPRDMAPTLVLNDDIVATATAMGVSALDATDALRAAEPGAFLNRDIHMTARGHQAVADALAGVLAKKAPAARTRRLAPGRTSVPLPSAWRAAKEITVRGSTKANCETKQVREWLRVACRSADGLPWPRDVKVVAGDTTDVMTLATPGAATLVAPLVRGRALDVVFSWSGEARTMTVRWADDSERAIITFGDVVKAATDDGQRGEPSPEAAQLCRCWSEVYGETCGGAYGSLDTGCLAAYATDCAQMVACVRRDPSSPPAAGP